MDSTDNSFDKLWYCFSNSMTMEQLLEFALTSKVILSYEIDYLNSFHDRLMQGLWKRSSNGCFYKMDDRHEKLAYILLNENYEADLGKSLKKLRNLSAAQKVFDEMSEPVLCLNESQTVSPEDNNPPISDFHHSDEVKVEDEQIYGHVNEEMELDGMRLAHNHHMVDEVYELRRKSEDEVQECTEDVQEIQEPNEQKMLDELPLPTFIKEMAQVASASLVGDSTPVSVIKADAKDSKDNSDLANETYVQQHDDLEYWRRMFAKLASLNGSVFQGLVVSTSIGRFSKLGLHSNSHQFCGHNVHEEDKFDAGTLASKIKLGALTISLYGRLNLEYLGPDIQKGAWYPLSPASTYHGFGRQFFTNTNCESFIQEVRDITCCIFIYDPGDMLLYRKTNSTALDFRATCNGAKVMVPIDGMRIFDPGGYKYLTCGGEFLNGDTQLPASWFGYLGAFHNLVTTSLEMDTQLGFFTLEDKGDFRGEENHNKECIWKLTNKSVVLLTFVFDPGSSALHVGQLLMEALNGLFIKKLFLLTCKSQLVLTFTLEDNNDFKDVGNDMSLAIWWRTSSLICARNHLIINHTILMTMPFTSFIFDPGGPYDKFWVVTFISFPRVTTSKECTTVWNFDPGGNADLLAAMISMSVSSTRDLFGIDNGWMNLMFSVYENAIVQSSEGSISRWLHNGSFVVHVEKISKALEHVSLKYVTELYLPLSLIVDSPSNYGNFIFLPLGYCSKGPSEAFFIFDPGGNGDVSGCTTIALIGGIGLGWKFSAKPVFFMPSNGDLRLSMHFYVQQDWNFILEYLLVNKERPSSFSTIYSRRKVHFDNLDAVCEGILPGRRSVDVKRMTTIGFLRKGEVCTRLGVTSSFIFDPGGYDNEPWMMNRSQSYQRDVKQPKARGYENHQAYVFDPGGSLLRFVIDAMMTKLITALNASCSNVMPRFNCHLF